MAGRDDERKELLGLLKARRASLTRASLEGATARVGEPAQWPAGPAAGSSGSAGAGRITIRETKDGLGVHVPSARHMFIIAFMLVWLAGWTAGEWFALSEIFGGGPGFEVVFLIFWLTLWSLGGALAAFVVLWQLFGVERLFITGGALVIEWGLGPFRRRKVWALDEVGTFGRPGNGPHSRKHNAHKGIAYTAGGKTRHFGDGLTASEVDTVLAAIHRHVPNKAASDAVNDSR